MTGEAGAPGVEALGLTKKFASRVVVNRVDFQVGAGETLGLFGPNGAGKTTLIRLLTSMLRASSGSFRIAGFDPRRDGASIRQRIGVISHQSFLYDDLTARQNLEFFARLYGVPSPRDRATELLTEVGLAHRAEDAVATFSRGMQQRMSLARALVHAPEILFLDEPFTGLDPHAARMVRSRLETVKEEGRTVLLVTHDLARGFELCDRWMILSRGRIVEEGRPSDGGFDAFESLYLRSSEARRTRQAAP